MDYYRTTSPPTDEVHLQSLRAGTNGGSSGKENRSFLIKSVDSYNARINPVTKWLGLNRLDYNNISNAESVNIDPKMTWISGMNTGAPWRVSVNRGLSDWLVADIESWIKDSTKKDF